MAHYAIGQVNVTNPQLMKEYAAKAGPTIGKHGGKVLIATADVTVKDGTWEPSRLVVIEFENEQAAEGWYDSPEYQELIGMRLDATEGGLVMVPGLG